MKTSVKHWDIIFFGFFAFLTGPTTNFHSYEILIQDIPENTMLVCHVSHVWKLFVQQQQKTWNLLKQHTFNYLPLITILLSIYTLLTKSKSIFDHPFFSIPEILRKRQRHARHSFVVTYGSV